MEKLGTNMTREDYCALENVLYAFELSEAEAILLINKNYGFEASKIDVHVHAIVAEYELAEIEPGRKVWRTANLLARKSLYIDPDNNYIRFNVCGNQYELVNGELCFYYD